MTTRVVVIGAGGFGRETLDVLDAVNAHQPATFDVIGVIDDAPSGKAQERLNSRNVNYLGRVDEWLTIGDDASYLVAVGNPQSRRRLADKMRAAGLSAATATHPASTIGSRTAIGAGTIICAGVQVSTNVIIGRHVHLNPSATIGHDTSLADFVSVNPAATISGECVVSSEALIGAGAVILQGLTLGQSAIVAAGACVVRDVNDAAVVRGVPAR